MLWLWTSFLRIRISRESRLLETTTAAWIDLTYHWYDVNYLDLFAPYTFIYIVKLSAQCLKITEKVALYNISSEARYILHLFPNSNTYMFCNIYISYDQNKIFGVKIQMRHFCWFSNTVWRGDKTGAPSFFKVGKMQKNGGTFSASVMFDKRFWTHQSSK